MFTQQLFELAKIALPILLTAMFARLQRKRDLKKIETGEKKPSDFHHFIK